MKHLQESSWMHLQKASSWNHLPKTFSWKRLLKSSSKNTFWRHVPKASFWKHLLKTSSWKHLLKASFCKHPPEGISSGGITPTLQHHYYILAIIISAVGHPHMLESGQEGAVNTRKTNLQVVKDLKEKIVFLEWILSKAALFPLLREVAETCRMDAGLTLVNQKQAQQCTSLCQSWAMQPASARAQSPTFTHHSQHSVAGIRGSPRSWRSHLQYVISFLAEFP